LVKVKYPDNKEVNYTYIDSTNHLLHSANDVNGYKVKYEYSNFSSSIDRPQVTRVSIFGNDSTISTDGTSGDYMDIEYGYNQTTFTDSRGRKEIKQFNNNGNVVSTRDEKGNAVFSSYITNSENKNHNNKLIQMSKLQNTSVNLFNDFSFENGSTNYVSQSYDYNAPTCQDNFLAFLS